MLLIRLSLLTLNDAVQSGNYTVLRDRGGPSFRQANSAAGLSRIFAGLEAQRPDLAAVAIMTPQLTAAEIVGPGQRLHVTGYFPGTVPQIGFDLTYEPATGNGSSSALRLVQRRRSPGRGSPAHGARKGGCSRCCGKEIAPFTL